MTFVAEAIKRSIFINPPVLSDFPIREIMPLGKYNLRKDFAIFDSIVHRHFENRPFAYREDSDFAQVWMRHAFGTMTNRPFSSNRTALMPWSIGK
jgi:hypothetical protein